jgi:putative oxidoreductase
MSAGTFQRLFLVPRNSLEKPKVHRHFGLFANWSGTQKGEGFEYHLLVIAITLAIMIKGSGAISLDRVL